MFSRQKLALSLLLVLLSLFTIVATACPPQPTSKPPATATGTLTLYNIDPYTLDPATSSEATSHEYIMQVFSGLVALDDNLNPAPDIARSWKVTGNGTIYTFTLRQDAKFHDGRLVKAEDFKYSWERACDPRTRSLTARTYLGDIVGARDVLTGKTKDITGVRVIDDYTLQVTIDAPKPYFLYKLAYVTAFVVDRNNTAKGGEWWRQPNGTGPFKLKQWQENQSLVLERNADYYGEKAGVLSVSFKLWAGVPMRMYETGEIDVTGVGQSYIEMVTDKAGPFHDELLVVPELSFSYIGFNCAVPPFDDPAIRRAFSMAIDKKKLVSLSFKDMVTPAYGVLPPGLPGYNSRLQGLEFNIEQAKALIKASRYGDVSKLPPITITTAGWGGAISSDLEAIVYEWRQNLGVTVKVRQIEPERFLYHLREEKDNMYLTGWVADYPHPQDFLEVLFHSKQEYNYGEYRNQNIDALLDKAGREPDNEKSLALYRQAEQLLVNDAACLPLWFGKNYILVKPAVKGYDPTPMGFAKLNRVSVSR